MLIDFLRYFILAMGFFYLSAIVLNLKKDKDCSTVSNSYYKFLVVVEPFVWFFVALGISDSILHTFLYRIRKTVEIKKLPGTLFLSAIVPYCFMSFQYISNVEIDYITLLILVAAKTLGYLLGLKLFTNVEAGRLKYLMSFAMLATAVLLFSKLYLFHSSGGTSPGLNGIKLIAAALCFFAISTLDIIGFASNALLFAILLLLGMSTLSVYPVIMTSSAIGGIAACQNFIKREIYHKKIAAINALTGWIGIAIAILFLKNINLLVLETLTIFMLLYNAYSMWNSQAA